MTPPGNDVGVRASRPLLAVATALLVTACGAAPSLSPSVPGSADPFSALHAVRKVPLTPPTSAATPAPAQPPATAPPASPSSTPSYIVLPPDPASAFGLTATTMGGCTIFPADNAWNQDVSGLSLDPSSAAYVASINSTRQYVHPDFGSDPTYGIPYTVVPGSQPSVPITFTAYGDESDPGPYPIPTNAPVESGSDRHVLVLDTGNCHLYEMYNAVQNGAGWSCDSGAVFNLSSDALRPDTWTSADAAGLPILPGLVRYDEVQSGVITHALRFTVAHTQNGFIHPATHQAGSANANLPPMGLRLRLKASFDLSPYHGASLVILTALKKYGMIVADNGSSWYVSGSTDTRWNDTDLDQLKSVPGSAFEAVQTGPILR
ncbi:MAG: hypothetical protein ACREN2_11740 [Candidatus Dormibacteria bacterium]